MKIAVDMDEVLCSLHEHWFNIHNTRYVKNSKDAIRPDQAKDWGMGTVPLQCTLPEMMAILNEPGVFLNLLPKQGAINAINKMLNAGHEIILVTACPFQHAMAEKIKWVSHFVPRLADKIIGVPSSAAKTMVLGMFDAVIDDNPQTLEAITEQPYKDTIVRILVDAPYNEFSDANVVYDYRVESLEKAAEIVDGLSKKEAEISDHITKCFRCMSNLGVAFSEKTQEISCSCCGLTAHKSAWNDMQEVEKKLRTLSLVELGASLSEARGGMERLIETELNGSQFIQINKSEKT